MRSILPDVYDDILEEKLKIFAQQIENKYNYNNNYNRLLSLALSEMLFEQNYFISSTLKTRFVYQVMSLDSRLWNKILGITSDRLEKIQIHEVV